MLKFKIITLLSKYGISNINKKVKEMNSILEFSEFFKKLKKLNYLILGSLIILIILSKFPNTNADPSSLTAPKNSPNP